MKTRGTNVILVGRKSDNYGYLKLTYRQGGKTIWHSLKIKVLKKDFNTKTQTMRQSANEANKINDYIESQINKLTFTPYKSSNVKTILVFMKKVIDITNVKSTKQKYENIYTLFEQFIKETYNKNDLYFEEIDSFTIQTFRNYLLTKKLKNTNNTANYKLKSLKGFFSKVEKEKLYFWQVNAFNSLNMKFDETTKNYLNLSEFKNLIRIKFIDKRKHNQNFLFNLNEIKDAFIFSTLSQGIRISDILTLRWNDFIFSKNDYSDLNKLIIQKKQIKTKKLVHIFIDSFTSQFIINQIKRFYTSKNYDIEQLNICLNDKNELEEKLRNMEAKGFLNGIEINENEKETIEYDLQLMNESIFIIIYTLISKLSNNKNYKTAFVFRFLDDKLFENIDEKNDFSQMTNEQFLQFQGRRSYVNKLLKDLILSKLTTKKLSFHSSRHTYTSLVLENDNIGINLYDLMKSLGHSNITSTEKYIKGFNYKKISSINEALSNSVH